ncbi:hypothetical protein DRP04_00890 [Archaeoglobales archaeon]|nr:MAG: hypothetical protein DRP04_00890 [Archaeoglobales archaeon]
MNMRRSSWSREFLDEVIRKYLSHFDPIEECINFQLSSIAGMYDVKLSSIGARAKEYVTPLEDAFVEAIDKKYRWASSPEGVMWALYINGHSYKEIAEIFGCAVGTVWNMIVDFQKKLKNL